LEVTQRLGFLTIRVIIESQNAAPARRSPPAFNDLQPIGASLAPLLIGRGKRQRIPNALKFRTARLAVLSTGEATMFKGIVIAVVVVLGASQLDQYYCHGKYTDGALSMLRQIRHSVRV